jgi:hypothetical protein
LNGVDLQTRLMAAIAGGIMLGVLLIATGWAVAQAAGVLFVGAALLLARVGPGPVERWLLSPRAEAAGAWRRGRSAAPAWAWPAAVGGLLAVALVVMAARVLGDGAIDRDTLGDLGKGVVALAMMATLALWNGASWRPRRRRG